MGARERTSPVVFVGAAIVMAAALAGVYVFFVRTERGQQIDELAFDGASLGQRTLAPVTLSLLDALPTIAVAVALVLALAVTIVRRNWLVFGVAIGAALAANVSTQLLKSVLLTRPELGVSELSFNSLPSGHTTVAASSALVVFLVASGRLRPIAAFAGASFTVVAGAATLANQWHRPSDVIAALLMVGFWGCVAGAVLAQRQAHESNPVRRVRMAPLFWVALPCVALAALAFVIAYLRVDSGPATLVIAYAGGVTSIIATGFLLAISATRTFRGLR